LHSAEVIVIVTEGICVLGHFALKQLRTEKNGETEKGCQKPALQQKTADDELIKISKILKEILFVCT